MISICTDSIIRFDEPLSAINRLSTEWFYMIYANDKMAFPCADGLVMPYCIGFEDTETE